MGLFDAFRKKPSAPPAPSPLRDLLFGDALMSQWPAQTTGEEVFPWSAFIEARTLLQHGDREGAVQRCKTVVEAEGLESRQYLQAWTFLPSRTCSRRPRSESECWGQ